VCDLLPIKSRFCQLRLASGLKERFLSADEDQKVKAVKALHKMVSTGGFKCLNAVIQCGVVPEIVGMGLLSHNWNVRAPCAAFMMSFLTFCWSSKQMTHEMLSGLFPKVTSSNPEVSMVVDHAKVLFASTLGSNPCHTTEPLVRVVPNAAPLTELFGPCVQSENTLLQCRPHSSPLPFTAPFFSPSPPYPLSVSQNHKYAAWWLRHLQPTQIRDLVEHRCCRCYRS
jgi:hypothetical protein